MFIFTANEARNSPEPGVDAFAQQQSCDTAAASAGSEISTAMNTMWLGTKSGNLYVYSSVKNYSKCLAMLVFL